jgi:ABC-type Fe3+-hydroxamate transport system substrate-binding protein
MPFYTDQLNRKVELRTTPQRIISLVPSQTELLIDLGVGSRLKGTTHFCIHPEKEVNSIEKIGGTKRLKRKKIEALEPDLIIGNKEENTKEDIEYLEKKYPVWLSDVNSLEDTYALFNQLGSLLNCEDQARMLSNRLQDDMESVKGLFQEKTKKKVAYFIWNKPMMVAANQTFINTMIQHLGFVNVFENLERYPEVDWSALENSKPEVIFLSSEPFPFKQKHIDEFSKKFPETDVLLVDGEMFSWYGSRLLYAREYFEDLSAKLN